MLHTGSHGVVMMAPSNASLTGSLGVTMIAPQQRFSLYNPNLCYTDIERMNYSNTTLD